MNWVTIKRIFRAGFLDFWRNGFVSFASILMMVFTLFVIGLTIFTGVILDTTLEQFRDKADMYVYFTTDAPEERIVELQRLVNELPQVASTQYISRSQVLDDFRKLHQNDQLTLQALDQLGANPFGATLNVKAKDISQYPAISDFIAQQGTLSTSQPQIVDRIITHQDILDRLVEVTASAKWIGFVVIVIFILSTIVISFNTLRLVIYISREEIQVMRLVGAGQGYIRAPFLVEGAMYGFIAGIITMLLFYPLTWWLGDSTESFFGGVNVFTYYVTHFPMLFATIVGSGILIGLVASFLAVRRYLKI